jgi:hypothetical protein
LGIGISTGILTCEGIVKGGPPIIGGANVLGADGIDGTLFMPAGTVLSGILGIIVGGDIGIGILLIAANACGLACTGNVGLLVIPLGKLALPIAILVAARPFGIL